jgi:hypothetical protein
MLQQMEARQVAARGQQGASAATEPAAKVDPSAAADMKPCRRCGRTNRRRMIALMSAWYAAQAGVFSEGGYFYLCPRCYHRYFGSQPVRPTPPPRR